MIKSKSNTFFKWYSKNIKCGHVITLGTLGENTVGTVCNNLCDKSTYVWMVIGEMQKTRRICKFYQNRGLSTWHIW